MTEEESFDIQLESINQIPIIINNILSKYDLDKEQLEKLFFHLLNDETFILGIAAQTWVHSINNSAIFKNQ